MGGFASSFLGGFLLGFCFWLLGGFLYVGSHQLHLSKYLVAGDQTDELSLHGTF